MDDTLQLIERFVTPFRGEFFRPMHTMHEVNWRRRHIYDSTAVRSNARLGSYIHANLTSPSARWFEFNFRDKDLNKNQAAREWIEEVQDIVWHTLGESDFSGEIAKTYLDLPSFGTNILLQEEVDDTVWKGIDFTSCPLMDTYFEMGVKLPRRIYVRKRWTALQFREKFPDMDAEKLPGGKPADKDQEGGQVDQKKEVILCIYHRPLPEGEEAPNPNAPIAGSNVSDALARIVRRGLRVEPA